MPGIIDRIRAKVREGMYMLTTHAIEEMTADGLAEEDVEAVVLNGRIVRRERDFAGRAKYTIEGVIDDGEWARTICRFSDSGEHIVVITVYTVEGE